MKKSIGSGRGSVYNIILKALQSGDKYGYEICKEVEEKTNGAYILKQPSLYSGLKRLEAQGDVKSYWKDSALGGRRHYYSLTESGSSRIEESDFNWQDARDEIVGTLFEKSELDKTIEDVEKDLSDINSSIVDMETQQKIDKVLSQTENLVNVEQKEEDTAPQQEESFVNFGGDDLFSMFTSSNYANDDAKQSDEEEKSDNEEVKEEVADDVEEETELKRVDETESEENLEQTENSANAQDKLDEVNKESEVNEQLDLFGFAENSTNQQVEHEDLAKEAKENEENVETEQKLSELELIEQNLMTKESEESLEENKNQEIESFDNSEDEKVQIMQKNEQNYVDEYIKQNTLFDSFSDNFLTETNENPYFEEDKNSFAEDSFGYFEDKTEETEDLFKFNDEKGFENLNFNTDETQNKESTEEFEEKKETQDVEKFENANNSSVENSLEKSFETVEETQKENNVDLKNIFGDLISNQSEKNTEIDDKFVYSTYKSAENASQVENTEKIDNESKNDYSEQSLPRNDDALKDINRTLMFDTTEKETKEVFSSSADFEKYDQTPFKNTVESTYTSDDPFEKYDTYESLSSREQEEKKQKEQEFVRAQNDSTYINRTSYMAFDKKYANVSNRFEVPDYEVRYYRKDSKDDTSTRFLSINKLNLALSFIYALFITLATTISLIVVSLNVEITGFQTAMFVISYLIAVCYLLFYFLKYVANKNKKTNGLKKVENMTRTFIAITITILAIAVNLFMGMNTDNITSYFASLIFPIMYAILIVLYSPLKNFLSKFTVFYK